GDRLPPARDARLCRPGTGDDGLLRAYPPRPQALVDEGHRPDLQAAPRGPAGGRPGAGAPLEAAAAARGGLLGVRHPGGPALRPALGGGAAQGPALVLLRRLRPPALALGRARGGALPLDRRPLPSARACRNRGRPAPA